MSCGQHKVAWCDPHVHCIYSGIGLTWRRIRCGGRGYMWGSATVVCVFGFYVALVALVLPLHVNFLSIFATEPHATYFTTQIWVPLF